MKYNTITNQVSETVPSGIYEGIDYHGTPPADVAERAGWVDVTPEIQAQLDAAAAAQQAARIASLLPDWGAHVARLNAMLAQIGMAIPTSREAVTAKILELLDSGDTTVGVIGLLLDKQYEMLAPVQNDVEAIWLAVQAMEGGE